MSENISKKTTMAKDTVIYMIAKAIEGIVGVLTVSLMSYIYLPELMNKYSVVYIAITTLGMVGVQWLVQSVLRYVNKYIIEDKLETFYSTIFFAWAKVMVVSYIIGAILIGILFIFKNNQIIVEFLSEYSIKLFVLGIIVFTFYSTTQLVIALLAGIRKVKINLILSIISVTGKIFLIWLFNTYFGLAVEWIFVSYAIIDAIVCIIGIYNLKIKKYIHIKKNSNEVLQELKSYGFPLMGNLITTQVLNKSDIYIITFLLGGASAGIYQTNYSIIASAFTLITSAVMRGSYPTILKTWSEGDKETSKKLISEALRFFLIISFPAVLGVFALSGFVANVFFAPEYFEGHSIMGFVALGMMFLGITEYCIKPWELNSMTKSILYRSLIGGAINVIINILFIKKFGYKFAGISTFIGFFIYFLLAKFGTYKLMKFTLVPRVYLNILFSGLIMCFVLIVCKNFVKINIINLFIMVILGIIIYFVSLYLTGEIKNEVKTIYNKIVRDKTIG